MKESILIQVKEAAAKRILFLPHAIKQMSRCHSLITPDEVSYVVFNGEVIEDYPEDVRGHSCLLLGMPGRPIHVVCSPKADFLAIITAYLPNPARWSSDFKRRLA